MLYDLKKLYFYLLKNKPFLSNQQLNKTQDKLSHEVPFSES